MRLYALAAMIAVGSLVCTSVGAQDRPTKDEDPRRAPGQVLLDEALRLLDSKMETEALEKLEKSYALYPSPAVLYDIARVEQLLGRKLAALRHYREAVRNPHLSPKARSFAKEFISELEPSFAHLNLIGPAGLVVSLGSEEVKLPLSEPLDMEPGPITVTGEINGQRYEGSGTAVAGQVLSIEVLKIEIQTPPPPTAVQEVLPPPTEETPNHSARYVVSGSLLAAGLVGVGLGIGFTVGANKASNDVTRLSTGLPDACSRGTNGNCDSLKKSDEARMRDSNLAVGSYIAGGALLTAGVATYLFWPKASTHSARVVPWVGKDVAGLTYGKEF
ncbi:MAG: hypothetical protein FWD69_19415 [Polyangiaceae bacterium]|nr:hypothetical protein [Polyangiaceae bacterium]